MERIGISTGTNITKLDNGFSISATRVEVQRVIPSDVSMHEAAHVVASDGIISATIIPSENALGTTIPKRMTVAAAGAPAALGHSGTSHDLRVAAYLGSDLQTTLAAGRAALKGQEEVMHEVATLLEERKTIGQTDVEEARHNVKKERNGIFKVEVQISSPEGKTNTFMTESVRGEISIKDLQLPEAA